jgi:hypothetical protein
MPEILYYLAYARSMTGDEEEALKLTDDLRLTGAEEWAADFVVLRAKLLLDASSFGEEVRWLLRNRRMVSGDSERAPMYYFLLGLGYRGVGDAGKGKQALSKVVSLNPEGELGKAASRLLSMR